MSLVIEKGVLTAPAGTGSNQYDGSTTAETSGNWTCPTGVTAANVFCWGGGGGGGEGNGGGGGGGGEMRYKLAHATTPGNNYAYVAGKGATGAFNSYASASTFVTNVVIANPGGKGGAGGTAGTAGSGGTGPSGGNNGGAGGAGSSYGGGGGGSGGAGSAGGNGAAGSTQPAAGGSPGSAGSYYGGAAGGNGGATGAQGSNGNAPGGGGGGNSKAGESEGGDGAGGRVLITWSGAGTGNTDYNLGSAFNGILPKALILWTTGQTGDGIENADAIMAVGFGTYRSSAAQHAGASVFLDRLASGLEQGARWRETDSILEVITADAVEASAITIEADFVSFTSGTPSSFRLNWVKTGTAIKVHYMVLGGTDITDALAGGFLASTTANPQDVTVATGFKPDLVLTASHLTSSNGFSQADPSFAFGAGKGNTEQRIAAFKGQDGATTMDLASWHKDAGFVMWTNELVSGGEGNFAAHGDWPTDGFRISWTPDQPDFTYCWNFLALKGTFVSTVDNASTPTSTGNQDLSLAGGGTPKGALFWGTQIPANASIDTSHGDLGGFVIGGTDGTNEGFGAIVETDGESDAYTGRAHSATKAFARHIGAVGGTTLDAEADSSVVGSAIRLNWTDAAGALADFSYVVLGEAPTAQYKDLTPITTTETVQALSVVKPIHKDLTPVSLVDTPQALVVSQVNYVTLTPITDTTTVQPLTWRGMLLPPRLKRPTGTVYYVDAGHGSASDSNAGTSPSAPWATFKKALDTLNAGEIVEVSDYPGQVADAENSVGYAPAVANTGHVMSRAGTEANPIHIRAKAGHRPIILMNGAGTSQVPMRFDTGAAWIIFEGFELPYSPPGSDNDPCLWGSGTSHDIEIVDTWVHGAEDGSGIFLGRETYAYQVYENTVWANDDAAAGQSHGIYTQGDDTIIVNNVVFDHANGNGIQIRVDTDSVLTGGIVAHNTVVRSRGSGSSNIIVEADVQDVEIWNNLLVDSQNYGIRGYDAGTLAGGNIARRNIAFGNDAGHYANRNGVDIIDWDGTGNYDTPPGDNLTSDPLLINEGSIGAAHDFHLEVGSPAYAEGNNLYTPPLDFDGLPRTASTLGAFRAAEESGPIERDLTPVSLMDTLVALNVVKPILKTLTPVGLVDTAQPLSYAGSNLPARIAESTGTTYYVNDELGTNDGSHGGSPGSGAWATITYAIANIPNPLTVSGGITIEVAGDLSGGGQQTYDENPTYNRTGDATHVVTIKGVGTNRPKIKHQAASNQTFLVSNAGDYFRLRRVELEGITADIGGGPVAFWNQGAAIVECDDVIAHGYAVNTDHSTYRWSAFFQSTQATEPTTHFWNCIAYDICADGIGQDNQSHGWYTEDGTVVLVNCIAYNIGEGFGYQLYPGTLVSAIMANCVGTQISHSAVVVHKGADYFRAYNCIFTDCGKYGIEETGSGTGDHAADHCITDDCTLGDYLTGSLLVVTNALEDTDPLFVSEAADNFRLQSGSPAIGYCDSTWAPPTDRDGHIRVGAPDAGAYERAPISVSLTPVTLVDTPQALVLAEATYVDLTPVTTTDTPQALVVTKPILKTLTPVTTTDTPQALSISQAQDVDLTPVTTTDTIQGLDVDKRSTLTPVTDQSAAQALDVDKRLTLTPVTTTETAQALSVTHVHYRTLTPVVLADEIQPLDIGSTIQRTLTPVTEATTARELFHAHGAVASNPFTGSLPDENWWSLGTINWLAQDAELLYTPQSSTVGYTYTGSWIGRDFIVNADLPAGGGFWVRAGANPGIEVRWDGSSLRACSYKTPIAVGIDGVIADHLSPWYRVGVDPSGTRVRLAESQDGVAWETITTWDVTTIFGSLEDDAYFELNARDNYADGAMSPTFEAAGTPGTILARGMAVVEFGGVPQQLLAELYGIVPVELVDEIQPLSVTKTIYKTLTPVAETATVVGVVRGKHVTLSPVTDTTTPVPLGVTHVHYRTLTPVVLVDEIVPLYGSKTLATITTTDTIQPLDTAKRITLTPVVEQTATVPLTWTHTHYRTLTPVTTLDIVQAVTFTGIVPQIPAGVMLRVRHRALGRLVVNHVEREEL